MSKIVEIPDETAEAVARLSAATGLTVAEVLAEGVRALDVGPMPGDEALERWLKIEAAAGYDEHMAAPDRAVDAGDLMGRLRARSAQRRAVRLE